MSRIETDDTTAHDFALETPGGTHVAAETLAAAEPMAPAPSLVPLRSRRPRRGDDASAAFEALCLEAAAEIADASRRMLIADRIEGAHALRVGLRRLRCLGKLFRPLLAPDFSAGLAGDAKRVAALAAPARALDVARTELVPAVAEVATAHVGAAAVRALERRLLEASARLGAVERAAAESAPMLVALQGRLARGDWSGAPRRRLERPARRFADGALERQWRRLFARAGDDVARLDVPARHALRIEVKAMRYAVGFFAPLYGMRRVAPIATALRKLQNTFGSLNDSAEAADLARFAPEPAYAPAIRAIVDAHARRLAADWPEAVARWNALEQLERFWRR